MKTRNHLVVTGASSGLGVAFARVFAKDCQKIVLLARRGELLRDVARGVQREYPCCTCVPIAADLSDPQQARAAAQRSLAACDGKIDVLINNAGQFVPSPWHGQPDDSCMELMHTNFLSAYLFTRSVLPAMVAHKRGHIFTICSTAALQAYPDGGDYGITKAALLRMSDQLRADLRPHHIKVTAVCPGAVWTPSWHSLPEYKDQMMTVEDVAQMVYACTQLSPTAVVETLTLRPLGGDISTQGEK